jgi:O-antigen ligase
MIAAALLALLAFAIPIEHKYDKLFRFFSLTLIPEGLAVSKDYDKKIYFYLSDIAALLLLGLSLFSFRTPLKRFFGNPIWIVFLCAAASIIASPFVHYPIAYIRLFQLLTPLALFSFLATSFNDEERTKITRVILIAIVTAGLCQTAIAITQYFHQAPLGLRLLGETNQLGTFPIENGSRWFFDKFLQRTGTATLVIRASGTFPHANVFGGFMLVSLLATYALILQAKKNRWILGLTIPIQLFALSLSYSRSALFAWILSTIIWFALILYQRGLKDRTIRFIGIAVTLAFIFVGAALFTLYAHRGGVLNYNAVAKQSDMIRHTHQKLALRILKDRPLTGLGFSQFSERSAPYFPPETDPYTRSTAPHNIFLFLACETGLISLAAFLSLIALLLWSTLRAPMTVEIATLTSLLIGFLFIGCCDFYPILFQQGKLMFFLLAGLLAAHVRKQHCRPLENIIKGSA